MKLVIVIDHKWYLLTYPWHPSQSRSMSWAYGKKFCQGSVLYNHPEQLHLTIWLHDFIFLGARLIFWQSHRASPWFVLEEQFQPEIYLFQSHLISLNNQYEHFLATDQVSSFPFFIFKEVFFKLLLFLAQETLSHCTWCPLGHWVDINTLSFLRIYWYWKSAFFLGASPNSSAVLALDPFLLP